MGWGGRASKRANQLTPEAPRSPSYRISNQEPEDGSWPQDASITASVTQRHYIAFGWFECGPHAWVRIVTVLANPRASAASPQSSNICVSDLAEKKRDTEQETSASVSASGEPRQAAKRGKRTHTMPSVSFNKEGGRTGEGRRRHGVDRGGRLPPSALARSPLGRSVARQNIVWKNESQSQVTQERGRGRDI